MAICGQNPEMARPAKQLPIYIQKLFQEASVIRRWLPLKLQEEKVFKIVYHFSQDFRLDVKRYHNAQKLKSIYNNWQ